MGAANLIWWHQEMLLCELAVLWCKLSVEFQETILNMVRTSFSNGQFDTHEIRFTVKAYCNYMYNATFSKCISFSFKINIVVMLWTKIPETF